MTQTSTRTVAWGHGASADRPHPGGYAVKWGDTLSGIARRYGTDVRTLARANHIADPDFIRAGATLFIPGLGGSNGGAPSGRGAAGPSPSPEAGHGENAAAVAEEYLGRNASDLEADRSDGLPMDAGVSSHVCCANFVSAVLIQAGELPPGLHTNLVAQLDTTLRKRGWHAVSARDARPGDVVVIQGGGVSHTEIICAPGRMIGSNNRNADGSQRISTGSLDWALQHGAVILRAPAGTGDRTAPGAGGAAAGGASGNMALPPPGLAYDGGAKFNPDVATLQQNLVKAGYLSQADMNTGIGHYGPRTRAAVARLQAREGIESDGGHFGPKTRAVLAKRLSGAGGKPAPEGAGGAGGPGENAPSHERRIEQAVSYFVEQGWSRAQAIGIVANLDAESGMVSGIHQQGGGPGYGLAQWEGPRQRDFQAWAGHSIHSSTFEEQLQFVQHELTHAQSGAGDALRRARTAADAAAIVTRQYERPADTAGEAARRAERATEIEGRLGR